MGGSGQRAPKTHAKPSEARVLLLLGARYCCCVAAEGGPERCKTSDQSPTETHCTDYSASARLPVPRSLLPLFLRLLIVPGCFARASDGCAARLASQERSPQSLIPRFLPVAYQAAPFSFRISPSVPSSLHQTRGCMRALTLSHRHALS